MNILFLCDDFPNYVPDLLLHGLRKLFGPTVVDYPRKNALYQGICGPPNLDPVPNLMPGDSGVDREDLQAKVERGFFDYVLADVRAFGPQFGLLKKGGSPLVVVDGEDVPSLIAPGPFVILRHVTDGNDYSIPVPIGIPIELIEWIESHAETPKTRSVGFLGSRSKHTPDRNAMIDEIGRMFPDALISSWHINETDKPVKRDDYYRMIQSCHVALNLPGAGLHAFRYWENAACNCLHLSKNVPVLIPKDFREGIDIVRFDTVRELGYQVERVMSGRLDWRAFAQSSNAWLRRHHTTEQRALQILDRLKLAFCK